MAKIVQLKTPHGIERFAWVNGALGRISELREEYLRSVGFRAAVEQKDQLPKAVAARMDSHELMV